MPICGRRWGKTAVGLMAILMGHGSTESGRPALKGAIDGGSYWWVAPSLTQIKSSKIWRHLKRACRGYSRPEFGGRVSEVDKEIILENGATIAVKSADSGVSLRGDGLSGVVLDEFPFLKEETWLEELRPSLSDTDGWAMMIGTPNGKNFAYRIFREAATRPGWQAWQLPTRQNPLIPPEELDEARIDMGPRRYAQEYEANFTDVEGATFPGSYFDHIWASQWPAEFEATALYLDPSLGKESKQGDYQSIVFAGVSDGLIWTDTHMVKVPPMELVGLFATLYFRYRPTWAGIESNGFQTLLQPLLNAWCSLHGKPPIPVIPILNTVKKQIRIASLDGWLAPEPGYDVGKIRVKRTPGGEQLLEQLQMFPDTGFHDDGPDALEGAVRLLTTPFYEEETDAVIEEVGI